MKKFEKKQRLQTEEEIDWNKLIKNIETTKPKAGYSTVKLVDFQDFFTAAVNHKDYLTEHNLKLMFDAFDRDEDEVIGLKDFNYVAQSDKWPKILKEIKQGATDTTMDDDEFYKIMNNFGNNSRYV